MIFIDKSQESLYFYNNGTENPNKITDIEITEEANNYYQENKERFNINLDNIPGSRITLDGIMEYGIDIKSKYQSEIAEIDKRLLEIRDKEYLDNLSAATIGEVVPALFSVGREKESLIIRRLELLREIESI